MDEQLQKSLISLIDETLQDIEDLKKSRFAASEIKIEGAGENTIAGKPVNGSLEKDEDKDEDDEDKEDSDEAMDKKEDKDEPHKDDPKHEEKEKKIAKELLDMHKKEDDDKDDEEKEEMKEKMKEMKKSLNDSESLMKSYIDSRIQPLESKLSSILDAVAKLADQPVPSKGYTAKFVPLQKSADAANEESLSKGDLATKLFDLKKSGTFVDSMDITRVELGQDLNNITKKYNLK